MASAPLARAADLDAQVLGLALDTSLAGDTPVAWSAGDPVPTIPAGQTFWFSITVQNTGTLTWGQFPASGQMPATFLSRGPDYNTVFGTYFISPGQGQETPPGATFTYKSGLRAPSTPGSYTMTWQLAQWIIPNQGTLNYDQAPWFGPQVTFPINVVARTDSAPPTPPRTPGLIDASNFDYVGSISLPDVPVSTGYNDDKTYFPSGITLRTVNGERRMILATGVYQQTVYEVAIPTPGKIIGSDLSAVPQAPLRTVFGGLPMLTGDSSNPTASDNGMMWYDPSTDLLYWANYNSYLTTAITFPILESASLSGDVLTPIGGWYQPDDPDGAPGKSFWGGVTSIPQDFADKYTDGKTLGVGFGGNDYSINASNSWGPALAAVSLPAPGGTMDLQSVFNSSIIARAPRDGNYFNNAPQPASPWAGTYSSNDYVGSGVFIDLPGQKGYVTFNREATGRIGYDYGGGNFQGTYQNTWNVYSYDELGRAATGAIPKTSVTPSSVRYMTLPNDATSLDQQIAGSAFDPTTRLLYVYSMRAFGPVGCCSTPPLVHVYYVTPDLQSLAVTKPPTKTSYLQGDALKLSGMVVTATYTDGSTKDVTANVTTDQADGSKLPTIGTKTVQVSYTDNGLTQTASFPITVAAKPSSGPTPPPPTVPPVPVPAPITVVSITVQTGGSIDGPSYLWLLGPGMGALATLLMAVSLTPSKLDRRRVARSQTSV